MATLKYEISEVVGEHAADTLSVFGDDSIKYLMNLSTVRY